MLVAWTRRLTRRAAQTAHVPEGCKPKRPPRRWTTWQGNQHCRRRPPSGRRLGLQRGVRGLVQRIPSVSLRAIALDVLGERAQVGEDALVVLVVRAQLEA